MTACPICGQPTPPSYVYCSRSCRGKAANRAKNARQAEVDQAAVWRLLAGHPVASTHGERVTAAADLTRCGYGAAQIATLLQVTQRTISRYRAEERQRTTP